MGRLYPATDLHFFPGAAGMQMRVFERFGGVWSDVAAFQNFTMQLVPLAPAAPPQAIVTLTGTRIDPGAEGVQLAALRISSTELTPNSFDIAIRATVHHELRALLLPITSLTLETDRSDRVLTVYGRFADGGGNLSTFDVTGHDYLQYAITPVSGANDAVTSVVGGRITTGANAGTAVITVSTAAGPRVSLLVTIEAAPTDRPILKRTFTGSSLRKRSLLMLSEGFVATEQARFETICRDIASHLLHKVPPYDLLRESFDVFSAFMPSHERGVTLGPPVVPVASPSSTLTLPVGAEVALTALGGSADFALEEVVNRLGSPASHHPPLTFAQAAQMMGTGNNGVLSQVTFDTWQLLATLPPQTRVRETAFGFILGERHYGTAVKLRPTDLRNPLDVMTELLRSQESTRTPWFDDRRLPELVAGVEPFTAHVAMQDRFVRTLRTPGGTPGVGAVWAKGGDSFGLVIYIVNHDYYGGLSQPGYVGMSIGAGIALSVVPSTAVEGLFDCVPVPVPLSAESVQQGFAQRPIWSIADVLAHELAHSTPIGDLNDEYAGGPAPASPEDVEFAEKGANTQLLANAVAITGAHAGVAIDPERLRWNWERVEAAAEIDDLVGSGAHLSIVLNDENWARWPSTSVGRSVFFRGRGTLDAGVPKSELLVIESIDPVNNVIHVATPLSSAAALITVFAANGVVILPLLDSLQAIRRLVDPIIINAMVTGPFSPSPGCVPNPNPAPPIIPVFQMPHDHNRLLAAYEAGATFNCGVIRPTAGCKMRTAGDTSAGFVPVDFCFVCKYIIAETIDPGSLGELDRTSYPK